ncbi:MAG: hypothetical protein FWE21_05075 [Defluviitaleaceae bacterium]|nr:hypothetical protein [Defluviitaleaceae bacterium]
MKRAHKAILSLCILLFTFAFLTGCGQFLNEFLNEVAQKIEPQTIPTLDHDIAEEKIDIAIAMVMKEFPGFVAAREETYVAVNMNTDEWFAYVFSKLDGGLGAEVSYRNGIYTVSFPYHYHQYRVRLISRMNELMPEMYDVNRFVGWSIPAQLRYVTISRGRSNSVSISIIRDYIDVDRQLEIDFEILSYVYELSNELGLELAVFTVTYYEGSLCGAGPVNTRAAFRSVERDASFNGNRTTLEILNPHGTAIPVPIARYSFTSEAVIRGGQMDECVNFENVLSSMENFVEYAKNRMSFFE